MSFGNSQQNEQPNKLIRTILNVGLTSIAFVVACAPVKFEKSTDGTSNPPPGCESTNTCVKPPVEPKSTYRNVERDVTVPVTPRNVDILIVNDNSQSMKPEQANMAAKFPTFIEALNNSMGGQMNWQLGIITTDMDGSGPLRDGNLVEFSGSNGSFVVNRNTPSVETLFADTIQMEAVGSGKERGIYAAITAVNKNRANWIRNDSILSVIILSDEDENSTAGRYHGDALESGKDYPADLKAAVQAKFGANKKLIVHAIIVQPGDADCRAKQSAQTYGISGEYGTQYQQLAKLTGGVSTGSVCADDYGSQLTEIATVTETTMPSIPLECVPFNDEIYVTAKSPQGLVINPEHAKGSDKVTFNPALPEGAVVHLSYKCKN